MSVYDFDFASMYFASMYEDLQITQAVAIARAMGIPDIEDAKRIEVGKTYLVPTVRTKPDSSWGGAWIPTLGPLHDDSDFIPDDAEHWHVDWRFIPESVYGRTVHMANEKAKEYLQQGVKNIYLTSTITRPEVAGAPQSLPLLCERRHLRWDTIAEWSPQIVRVFAEFAQHLEHENQAKRACNDICPHRGVSLIGAPLDERGARVCPGHGLCWSKDGRLMPRVFKFTSKADDQTRPD